MSGAITPPTHDREETMVRANEHLQLDVTDYNETEQAEMTNRCLEGHQDGLVEWYGYGEVAGLRARATYLTTEGDEKIVEDNGGDWGGIDWDARLAYVDILTDDGVVVVTIDNPDHDTSDADEDD